MRDEALHVCLVGAAASKCDRCHFDGHWRDMVTVSSEPHYCSALSCLAFPTPGSKP